MFQSVKKFYNRILGENEEHIVMPDKRDRSSKSNVKSALIPSAFHDSATSGQSNMKHNYEEPEILTLSSDDEDTPNCHSNASDKVCSSSEPPPLINSKEPIISSKLTIKQFNREHVNKQKSYFDDKVLGSTKYASPVSMQCRNIRIGSYKAVPTDRILFVQNGIQIIVPPFAKDDRGSLVTITLNISSILKILAQFDPSMPVIFIYLLPQAAAEIRQQLQMRDRTSFFFDPCSHEESHRRITLMPEKLNGETVNLIRNILDLRIYDRYKPKDSSGVLLLEEITVKEANEILIKSSPMDDDRNHHNNQRTIRTFESATLFVYPPAPSKGGITVTTYDYNCLKMKEFLNDVLIDFYLKWLLLNKLDREDMERTHVFSSFFYRRLTAKPNKNQRLGSDSNGDVKVSPAVRRHDRVKSWTKNVDIFTKDFLLVPINERAHWFLAVICYPGLKCPIYGDGRESVSKSWPTDDLRRSSRVKRKVETIPIDEDDGEFSDRDEAEGNDTDVLEEDEGDPEPPCKKTKSENINQPCILIFDSMPSRSRANIIATLREYLQVEFRTKKKETKDFNLDTIPGCLPRVPLQLNDTDCGIFVLQYAEYFFKKPITDFRLPIYGLAEWFSQDEASKKRENLALLIQDLLTSMRPNAKIALPFIDFSNCDDIEGESNRRASFSIQRSTVVKTRPSNPCSEPVRIPGICEDAPPAENEISEATFLQTSSEECLQSPTKEEESTQVKDSVEAKKKSEDCLTTENSQSENSLDSSNVSLDNDISNRMKEEFKPSPPLKPDQTRKVTKKQPDYIKTLKKSKALQKILSASSSLKLLADSYDYSSDET